MRAASWLRKRRRAGRGLRCSRVFGVRIIRSQGDLRQLKVAGIVYVCLAAVPFDWLSLDIRVRIDPHSLAGLAPFRHEMCGVLTPDTRGDALAGPKG